MSQFVRRLLAALVTVTLIGALGACSDDEPSANGDPTPTPTPSETSPSPTPTGPVEPEAPVAMNFENKRGAKAFVKYYWDVVNYAQATGDVKTLRQLNVPECIACGAIVQFIRSVYSNDERLQGGKNSVFVHQVAKLQDATGTITFPVDFTTKNSKQQLLNPDGSVKKRFPSGSSDYTFVVHLFPEGWKLADVESRS